MPVLRDIVDVLREEGMPENPPPPLNEASSSYNRAQPIERVAMDEIYRLFSSYDADVDHKITESEFLAGVASLSLPPSCDPAAAFALLDVDGSGTLSLNELCIAIGPDLLAAKAQGVTATACLSKVIANLTAPDATNIAAPTPMEIKRTPERRRTWEVDGCASCPYPIKVCDDYCGMCFPCAVLWYGGAFTDDKLVGLSSVIDHVTKVKTEPVEFLWSIKNYHVVRHEYLDQSRTPEERKVYTHSASMRGYFSTEDRSDVFVPLTSSKETMLEMHFTHELAPAFKEEYQNARDRFYSANTRDDRQEKEERIHMPSLSGICMPEKGRAKRVQWLEGESKDPWWTSCACRYTVAAFSCCCGPCWLFMIRNSMGFQQYTFHKSLDGFSDSEGQRF